MVKYSCFELFNLRYSILATRFFCKAKKRCVAGWNLEFCKDFYPNWEQILQFSWPPVTFLVGWGLPVEQLF